MKFDLATSFIAAIAGIIVAYFATNFLIPPLEDVSFKTLESTVDASLSQPNEEIFNYRAVNPTVEVYVGQCLEYNENGECIDDSIQKTDEEDEEKEDEENENKENEAKTEDTSGESENGTSN